MSTWVTSCTSLISRRNVVKCATHLKTVFIPTTQPHPSLTSSTACICHHLWKVEFSSSWRQLFNQQNSWQTTYNIHAVVVQLCLIRKIYNKILALILGLLWCIQWHHFQQSRIVKTSSSAVRSTRRHQANVCNLWSAAQTSRLPTQARNLHAAPGACDILRELNHNLL